ncbi:MAG TPA: 30S ribosomal protein S11 [Candidatus Polarisedimenticolaceae bacterium]|nr:30S ribosomal protein S11 [Candidatus Polarisedimenticolaceae bacterium]
MAKTATKATRRKKTKRNVAVGQVHIHATFNNTIISITDEQGGVIAWASAGGAGFKGSRKSTPYAAGVAAERAAATAKDMGLVKAHVLVRGIGSGRESAVRALAASNIQVTSIKDTTPVAHNGCRPKKARRV